MASVSTTKTSEDISEESPDGTEKEKPLSDRQRARIERNRQKALLLRQARLTSRPYTMAKEDRMETKEKGRGVGRVIDTGGGFLLEEEDAEEEASQAKVVHQPGAIIGPDHLMCEECGKEFLDSWLHATYDAAVCDNCRDNEEKHKLITKTEAKNKYLLKDADFDKREPPLKFVVRKNPHNERWGDMKLFLESQVYDRAMEVWEKEERIEEEKEKREAKRDQAKQKKFDKKVKELRMAVRSSLWKKDSSTHQHEYGEETYNEEEDVYTKRCTTCGHSVSYEKM